MRKLSDELCMHCYQTEIKHIPVIDRGGRLCEDGFHFYNPPSYAAKVVPIRKEKS